VKVEANKTSKVQIPQKILKESNKVFLLHYLPLLTGTFGTFTLHYYTFGLIVRMHTPLGITKRPCS